VHPNVSAKPAELGEIVENENAWDTGKYSRGGSKLRQRRIIPISMPNAITFARNRRLYSGQS
jgi:hypothetical protein